MMKNSLIRRTVICLLIFSLLAVSAPLCAGAAETQSYAQANFDGSADVNIIGRQYIEPGAQGTPVYTTKDGVTVTQLSGDGGPEYIGINVTDGLFAYEQNTSLKITIRYFDQEVGFATIRYSNVQETAQETEKLFMEGSGTWKEHAFILDRCAFRNSEANGSDFLLARWSKTYEPDFMESNASTTPMYVQWIRVEECFPKNLFDVTVTSEHTGNIFAGDDEKLLYVNATNWYTADIDATLSWRALDFNHNVIDEGGKINITIPAGELRVLNVNPSVTRYGSYLLEVAWKFQSQYKDNLIESFSDTALYDFSVMNKIKPNEETNRMLKTNSKFEFGWYDEDGSIFTEVIRSLGFSGVRDDWRWNDAERTKGVHTIPESLSYDGITYRTEAFDWITPVSEDLGDILYTLGLSNSLYINDTPVNGMPDDELWPGSEQAFLDYVDWVSSTFGDKIKYYQYWNEPQGTHFNGNNTSPEKYAAMLRKIHNVIEENDPEGQVVGLAVAYTPSEDWVRRALAAGAADYMDAASTHPYDWDGQFTAADYISRIREFKKLFVEAGHPDMPIYLTEMGVRDMVKEGWPNANGQAAQVVQSYIVTQGEELADLYYYFTAIDNFPGILWKNNDGDARWGLLYHQNEAVPYAARPAAIATAAYNKLIGNAEIENKWSDYAMENGSYVYQFKRESDGKDVVVYWTENGSRTFGLNLGTEQVEVFDMFSNSEGTLYATDEIFTLTSSAEPTYLVGNFSKFEITEPKITTDGGRKIAAPHEVLKFKWSDSSNRDLQVQAFVEDNLNLMENNGIIAGKGNVTLQTGDTFYIGDESVTVKIFDGSEMVYMAKYHLVEDKETAVSVVRNGSMSTIKGSSVNSYVTLHAENCNGERVYMNQLNTDTEGKYELTAPIGGELGFTLYIRDENRLFVYEFPVKFANITGLQNGEKPVEKPADLDCDTVTMSIQVEGQTIEQSAIGILAYYDDNHKLLNCKISDVLLPIGSHTVETTFENNVLPTGCSMVQCFLWDSLGTMSPVCEKKIIEKTS